MEAVERAFVDAAGDRSHGATAIERRLLERLIATDAPNPTAIARGARALRHGQPAMGNLVSLASRALDADVASFLDWAALRLEILRDLNERLAIAAWPVVRRAEVVVTVSGPQMSGLIRPSVVGPRDEKDSTVPAARSWSSTGRRRGVDRTRRGSSFGLESMPCRNPMRSRCHG